MRLRYLRVQNLPPLQDLAITFRHEPILGRECAIHFVVGVNGRGKTRLLQALAEIFLSLERRRLPHFPVTLFYDLGRAANRRTFGLHYPGGSPSQAAFLEFDRRLPDQPESAWKVLAEEQWALRDPSTSSGSKVYRGDVLPALEGGAYLPNPLLAYTSGTVAAWQQLFAPQFDEEEFTLPEYTPDDEESLERPPGWSIARETDHLTNSGQVDQAETLREFESPEPSYSQIGLFVPVETLKLAVFALTLKQAIDEYDRIASPSARMQLVNEIKEATLAGKRMPGLRGLLNEVGWLQPISASLHFHFNQEDLMRSQSLTASSRREQLVPLFKLASSVLMDPEPKAGRQLFFDLFSPVPENPQTYTATALFEAIGGENATPFDVFRQLYNWHREGLLANLTIALRKQNLEGVLLYDWLSDGEQVFLGRMALFHLLKGRDDALILLDEPETHFNDVWKREVVDIIDDSLRDNASEVVISTHSSIALTDVFDTEITSLRKGLLSDEVNVVEVPIRTFGASPNEIMRDVFGTDDTVGQRATEFLDMVLMVAAHPDQVQAVWALNGDDEAARDSEPFKQLWSSIQELPHTYEDDERLLSILKSIRAYTQQVTGQEPVTVTAALTALQERLGPGYYQFEFRRRLRALRDQES